MKTTLSLLAALGLASLTPAMAQMHSTPQSSQEVEAAPGSGASGGASSSQSGAGPESAADISSGASSPSDAATDTSSGASSTPDTSSGASNAMQSEAGAELRPPPSPTAHLKPVTQDDVTYLCGGVGTEEANYMKRAAKDYDLMLTFATRSGDYLADVDVDIKDAKGETVLQAACDSPIMLVDLPRSGNYRVRAETAGYTLNRMVRVTAAKRKGASLASTVLTWPQRVAEAGGGAATTSGSGDAGRRNSGAADDSD